MKDGELLVLARNGCLAELYEACHLEGFRGRCYGSRSRKHPSPIPGSNIILGNEDEVVIIYQSERGQGPIEVLSYLRHNGASTLLSQKVKRLLGEAGLYHSPPD